MKIMRHSFKSFVLFLALLASPVFAEDFSYTLTTADQALNLTTTAGNTYTVNFPSIAAGSSLSGFTYSGDGTVILKGPEGRINISTNNSGFTGTLVVDSARISSSGNMGSGTILLQNGGNLMNSGGASNYTQNIQLGTGAGGFKAGWSTTLTLSGVISDYTGVSGVLKDIKDNGPVVINNAANTYTGGTVVAYKINIGSNAANGTPLGTGSVSFSASEGTLDLQGQTITIGGLDATTGTVTTSSGSPTLTLNVPAGAEYTYSGAISGAISIVKSGEGTQIFGASAKGYTGKTTVTGGTLKLADGVSSYSAATLNGGTLSVDTSSGITLTVQKDGGTFDWRASGTTAVSVALKGDSTTTADTVFTFNGITNPTGNCNTLKISSVTDYPGKIRLSGGKWSVDNTNQLPSGTIILDGGTFMMNIQSGSEFTVPNNFEITSAGGSLRPGGGGSRVYKLTGTITGTGELGISCDNTTFVLANSGNTFSGGLNLGVPYNASGDSAVVKLGADNALGSGVVTVTNAGATLDLAGYSVTTTPIAGLSTTLTAADIKNSSSTASTLTLNVPDGKSYSYVGKLSGNINLVKGGAGTQILGASAKGYTGTTTITGGTLKLADGVSSYSAATLNGGTLSADTSSGIVLTVQKDGGTLDWRASGTTPISVTLKGDETTTADTVFTFNGITNPTGNCNTLKIASVTDNPGKIRLSAGKWSVTNSNQLPSGTIILDGGTFMMNITNSSVTVPNNFEVTSNGGSIRPGGGGSSSYKLTGTITGTGELGISGDNATFVFANSGNTFSGGLNLGVAYNVGDSNSATVKLGANNALGSGLVTVTNSKSKLDLAGYSITTRPIAGLSTTQAAADIKNSSSTASTLTLNVAEGSSYSYVGKLSGKINLVKNGAGTQTLSGTGITFSGLMTVGDGTLDLPGVTLSSLSGLSGTSASAILKNSKTDGTTALTLNTTSDQSYAGQISGKFSITKTGSAKQTFNGSKLDANFAAKISEGTLALTSAPATQNGSYTLDGGTLNVTTSEGTAVKLGTALKTTANGGTVIFNASATPRLELGTLSGNGDANTVITLTTRDNATGNCPSFYFTVPASYLGKVEVTAGKWVITNGAVLPKAGVILSGGEIMGGDGTPDITSPLTLTEGKLSTLRSGFSKSLTVSSQITGAGQLGIATDSGTITLKNSANDFSGGLVVGTTKNSNVGQGTLKAGAENVFGTGSLTVLSASNQNSVDLNGFDQTVGGLSSDGANALVYDSTGSLANLTLNVPLGQSFTYSGILRDVDLVKTGLGTQTVSGALTGVGDVQVQAGTLEMADQSYDMAGTSISLSDNAVLALNDVTITNLDFLDMTGSSVIKPTGDSFSVAIDSFLGDTGMLTWDGTTLGGNLSYYLTSNGDGGYILNPSAVPEPSAWILLLLGTALLAVRRKRL